MLSRKSASSLDEKVCSEEGKGDGISVQNIITRRKKHSRSRSSSSNRSSSNGSSRSNSSVLSKTLSFYEDSSRSSMESSYTDYSDDFSSDMCTESCSIQNSKEKAATPVRKKQYKMKNRQPVDQTKANSKTTLKKLQRFKGSFLNRQSRSFSQIRMVSGDPTAVACRILSARIKRIKELKNEISDLKRRLEATSSENKVLKRLQQRHIKALMKFEGEEGNLSQLLIRHNNEVRTLRQLLRKSQEQGRGMARKLKEADAELLRTRDMLQKLQMLSEDKNLAERNELTQRLSIVTEKLDCNEKRIQELEKCMELSNKCFTHQLAAETKKTLEAQEFAKILQMEVYLLDQKIREKEKELDIRNIYANRMIKGIPKKDVLSLQTKGDSLNKAVQTDQCVLPSTSLLCPVYQDAKPADVLQTQFLSSRTVFGLGSKKWIQLSQSGFKKGPQRWQGKGAMVDSLRQVKEEERTEKIQNGVKHTDKHTQEGQETDVVNHGVVQKKSEEEQRGHEPMTVTELKDGELCNLSNSKHECKKPPIGLNMYSDISWMTKAVTELQKENRYKELQDPKHLESFERENRNTKEQEEQTSILKEEPEKERQVWILKESGQESEDKEKWEHEDKEQQMQNKNKISKELESNFGELSNTSLNGPSVLPRPRKYKFTEPIENLHQGLPAYGTSQMSRSRSVSGHVRRELELGATGYEPSFGKSTNKVIQPRQKRDTSQGKEEEIPQPAIRNRKSNLMEELFGPSTVLDCKPSRP